MESPLQGLSILVVEDEPLIAMDIAETFRDAGAEITITNTKRHALILAEHDGLSSAILDHALKDGDSSALYEMLNKRGIPFMIYSGYEKRPDPACKDAPYLSKPATRMDLVAMMKTLMDRDSF